MLVCVSISLIYSLVDKLQQLYVPERYASLLGVGLNVIGVVPGSIFLSIYR
jgi:VanZ family protein